MLHTSLPDMQASTWQIQQGSSIWHKQYTHHPKGSSWARNAPCNIPCNTPCNTPKLKYVKACLNTSFWENSEGLGIQWILVCNASVFFCFASAFNLALSGIAISFGNPHARYCYKLCILLPSASISESEDICLSSSQASLVFYDSTNCNMLCEKFEGLGSGELQFWQEETNNAEDVHP